MVNFTLYKDNQVSCIPVRNSSKGSLRFSTNMDRHNEMRVNIKKKHGVQFRVSQGWECCRQQSGHVINYARELEIHVLYCRVSACLGMLRRQTISVTYKAI